MRFADDERVGLIASHIAEIDNTAPICLWSDTCLVPFGSMQLDPCIDSLVDGLVQNLRPALEQFIAQIQKDRWELSTHSHKNRATSKK